MIFLPPLLVFFLGFPSLIVLGVFCVLLGNGGLALTACGFFLVLKIDGPLTAFLLEAVLTRT